MATLSITCFGSPRIELNGKIVELETRKGVALLIYILLNRQPQRREKLVSMFWPESPSKNAFASLRRTLWAIKNTLTDQWFDFGRHTIAIDNYTGLWGDVLEFQQLLEPAIEHPHEATNACDKCLQAWCSAVRLYTDDFLQGFTLADCPEFDDWQFFQTDLLRSKLNDTLKRIVGYYTGKKDLPQAIHHAKLRIARNAWDEAAHRELMRLYALNHQRSEALQQYHECARILKEELHILPEPQTTELFEAISTHPEQLFAPEQVTALKPPPTTSQTIYQATPFVGRDRELEEITRLLAQPNCHLLTLLGLGGIGKTRLAQQMLSRMRPEYQDGVYFVSLTAIPSADLLVPTLAETFQFSPSPGEEYRTAFWHFLAGKHLLLILDNFEHLLAGVTVLKDILQHAPDVRLLVTSRERLRLEEEWVYEVPGLSFPAENAERISHTAPEALMKQYDAVQFFIQSARRIHDAFTLSEKNLPNIVTLCQRVDGMPLALELAASWCKMLPCHQIVEEIERSLDFLASRSPEHEPRHQSIRAVFQSVWNQLTNDDQHSLCKLAVFQGGFDAKAAHAIAILSLPHLAEFVNRSLVKCDTNGRFMLHPLLQRFLAEYLREPSANYGATREAFREFYVNLLLSQWQNLKTEHQHNALHTITRDLPNIHAVWQTAIMERNCSQVQGMLPGLCVFYDIQSRFQEGKDLFQQAVEHWKQSMYTPQEDLILAQLRVQYAVFTMRLTYGQDISALYQDALPILAAHDDAELAFTYLQMGWLKCLNPLEKEEAEIWIAKGKQLAEAKNDVWEIALALYVRGDLAQWGKAEYEEAKGFYQRSLELRQRIGDWWGQANALNSLGHSSVILGRYQEAQWFHREALRISQDVNDLHGIAWAKAQLADIARVLGQYQDAWTLNWEVYRLAMRFGNQGIAAWRLLNVGRILLFQGHHDDALHHAQQSLLLFQRLHHRQGEARAILDVGRILFQQDQIAEAHVRFQESLAQFQSHRNASGEAMARYYLGCVHYAFGQVEQAFEHILFALQFACEKGVIGTILRYSYGLGELLVHSEDPRKGLEILAFVAHHLATPAYVKKRAQALLAKQEQCYASQEFQTAIDTGKRMTVEDIRTVFVKELSY